MLCWCSVRTLSKQVSSLELMVAVTGISHDYAFVKYETGREMCRPYKARIICCLLNVGFRICTIQVLMSPTKEQNDYS
uniref:Uncharacterized protein n=1 Tax=Rhizophora mucronata TaxID=61149 RepID=A0A2P2MB81_RHIMU